MTRALLRHRIETKLLAAAAAAKVGGSPKVTEAQIKAQYAKDKATLYVQPERRQVRHILVKTKALADQIYSQLSSSDASFAALAKKYSTDSSKDNGGDLGVVNRNGLVKPFADVAFTLDQGVVSEPVKTQFGWHIIEPMGPILPKSTKPLDAALTKQIRDQLVEKARQKHIAQRVRPGGDRAQQEHRVRAGLRPADRGNAVTDGATAPLALIVALGPGEPELVPAAALEALSRAGSAAPHGLPEALAAALTASGIRLESSCRHGLRAGCRRLRAGAERTGRRDAARAAAARAPGRPGRGGRPARADRGAAPRVPVGSRADGDLDRAAHRRGGVRGRRRRARGRPLPEAARRARRPALPDDVPRAALRGGRGRLVGRRRARRRCQAATPPPVGVREPERGVRGRRSQPLGGRQGRERGPRRHLPRRAARAAGTARGAQGAAPRGRDRVRVRHRRRRRSAISRARSASCEPSWGTSPSPSASR